MILFILRWILNTSVIFRYGKDWDDYKKIVPYRIIPYVY